MPAHVLAPGAQIPVHSLTQAAFSSFGTVVQNPSRTGGNTTDGPNAVKANQGTALKYIDVSHLTNHYNLAPSRKPAKAVLNMFVCSPRPLQPVPGDEQKQAFGVKILERHPFTPQTFIPVGQSQDDLSTSYLVIVAPTLPTSSKDARSRPPPYPQAGPRPSQGPNRRRSILDVFSSARPSPFTNTRDPPSSRPTSQTGPLPKGPGQPDLANLKAFLANGSQAVTYGPGTWHAPMVVLGANSIDFVVVQYANGVALEDCQEIEIDSQQVGEGIDVVIDDSRYARGTTILAKL